MYCTTNSFVFITFHMHFGIWTGLFSLVHTIKRLATETGHYALKCDVSSLMNMTLVMM